MKVLAFSLVYLTKTKVTKLKLFKTTQGFCKVVGPGARFSKILAFSLVCLTKTKLTKLNLFKTTQSFCKEGDLIGQGARFSKVPKSFRARKAIRKTPTCLFCKAGLFHML